MNEVCVEKIEKYNLKSYVLFYSVNVQDHTQLLA